MSMDCRLWSLLKLNPQKQRGYVDLLHEYIPNVESYYPVFSRMVRPHGVRKPVEVIRPVYPGYLFVRIIGSDIRGPISLPIPAHYIRFGGKIECVRDTVVKELQRLEVHNLLVREVRYVNPYAPGVQVRVYTPAYDLAAVVVRLVRGGRVEVDTVLGRVLAPVHAVQVV